MGDFVWASARGRGEVCGSRGKFSGREEIIAEKGMRLLRACDLSELGQVASGAATQGITLGSEKLGSQKAGVDRRQLLGKRTVGKVREGGR